MIVLFITAAGADFSLGRDQGERPPNMTRAQNTRLIVEANRALAAFPGIAVAAVRGRALGFACGLAVQADITIAAADATLGFDEVHTARPPRFVMSYLADYIGPKRAMDMVVTGRMLVGPQAGPVELGTGDLVTFAADVPHVYEALETAHAVLLMSYP